MEINEKIFEFIQRLDLQTEEGVQEFEHASTSLDGYIRESIDRSAKHESQILHRRRVIKDMVKNFIENVDNPPEEIFELQKKVNETPAGEFDKSKSTSRVLKNDFFEYFFSNLGVTLDIDEDNNQKLIVPLDQHPVGLYFNSRAEIEDIKLDDTTSLTTSETRELAETFASDPNNFHSYFKDVIAEKIEKYGDHHFLDTTLTSDHSE